jgi:hypothetical protein
MTLVCDLPEHWQEGDLVHGVLGDVPGDPGRCADGEDGGQGASGQ